MARHRQFCTHWQPLSEILHFTKIPSRDKDLDSWRQCNKTRKKIYTHFRKLIWVQCLSQLVHVLSLMAIRAKLDKRTRGKQVRSEQGLALNWLHSLLSFFPAALCRNSSSLCLDNVGMETLTDEASLHAFLSQCRVAMARYRWELSKAATHIHLYLFNVGCCAGNHGNTISRQFYFL